MNVRINKISKVQKNSGVKLDFTAIHKDLYYYDNGGWIRQPEAPAMFTYVINNITKGDKLPEKLLLLPYQKTFPYPFKAFILIEEGLSRIEEGKRFFLSAAFRSDTGA